MMKKKNIILSTILSLFIFLFYFFIVPQVVRVEAFYRNGVDGWCCIPYCCDGGCDGLRSPRAEAGQVDNYDESCVDTARECFDITDGKLNNLDCCYDKPSSCDFERYKGTGVPIPSGPDLRCCLEYYKICWKCDGPPPPPPPDPFCGDGKVNQSTEECDGSVTACRTKYSFLPDNNMSCNPVGHEKECRCCIECIPYSCEGSRILQSTSPTINTPTPTYNPNFIFPNVYNCLDGVDCIPQEKRGRTCYEMPGPQPAYKSLIFTENIPTTKGFWTGFATGGGKYIMEEGVAYDDRVNDPLPILETDPKDNNRFYVKATYEAKTNEYGLEAVYVWFKPSNDSQVPLTPYAIFRGDSSQGLPPATASRSNFGFMLYRRQNGSGWSPYIANQPNQAIPYITQGWKPATYHNSKNNSFAIKGPYGNDIANIILSSVKETKTEIKYGKKMVKEVEVEFTMSFKQFNNTEKLLEYPPIPGQYSLWLMAHDEFGFTPLNIYQIPERLGMNSNELWTCSDLPTAERTPRCNELIHRFKRLNDDHQDVWDNINMIRYPHAWVNTGKVWDIDTVEPSQSGFKVNTIGGSKIRASWNYKDELGISALVLNLFKSKDLAVPEKIEFIRFFFDNNTGNTNPLPDIKVSQYLEQPIELPVDVGNWDSYTLGHLNFAKNPWSMKIGGGEGFGGVRKSGNTVMNLELDLRSIGQGWLHFFVTSFDLAGNVADINYLGDFDTRDWMATKGSLLYSSMGIDLPDRDEIPEDSFENTILDDYFKVDEIDITSELSGAGAGFLEPRKSIINKSYAIKDSYKDIVVEDIIKTDGYYTTLRAMLQKRRDSLDDVTGTDLVETEGPGNYKISKVLNNNAEGQIMLIDLDGNLTVGGNDSGSTIWKCNGRAVIFVSEDLTILGDIRNHSERPHIDACIFVVKGDVILAGGNNANNNEKYDQVNAYILSDGQIQVEEELTTKPRIDGFYISGGIHTKQQLLMKRNLHLADRFILPAFVVNHHSKYGILSRELFGSQVNIQKTIVGLP